MWIQLAVLASGEGSTFESIVRATRHGAIDADIVGLIVDQPAAGALKKAEKLGIPSHVVAPRDFESREAWDNELQRKLEHWKADLVVSAGFLKKLGPNTLKRFPILNTHPGLLPEFGGKGMYGRRVHEAVLRAQATTTGVSLHWVNENYDEGPLLAQRQIPVFEGESVEELEDRVKFIEKQFLVEALQKLSRGEWEIPGFHPENGGG